MIYVYWAVVAACIIMQIAGIISWPLWVLVALVTGPFVLFFGFMLLALVTLVLADMASGKWGR